MSRKQSKWISTVLGLSLSLGAVAMANTSAVAAPAAEPSPSATSSPAPSPNPSGDRAAATPAPAATTEAPPTPVPTTKPMTPPDNYTPPDGVLFNRPYNLNQSSPNYRWVIRNHVLRSINSVPSGEFIRFAVFSLDDPKIVDALIAARNRGVTVQVIANQHMLYNTKKTLPPSKEFKRLRAALGTKRTKAGVAPDRVNFAVVCQGSCRGYGADNHYKMFMFSKVGAKSNVVMMGSPNLTNRAAWGQWNHLNTYTSAAAYNFYKVWMNEMRYSHAMKQPYKEGYAGDLWSWTFPLYRPTAAKDPMMKALNNVRCTGVSGGAGYKGRTVLRFGAYTFYDTRGRWIAKKVRSLWNSGCNISIEYAIMGDTVKGILSSPAGRGRIPMKRIATYKKGGAIDLYDHNKYFAISGHYNGQSNAFRVVTGTNNISDFGFASDDTVQVFKTAAMYWSYKREYDALWKNPYAKVSNPTSRLGVNPSKVIGKGAYANLEEL